MPGTGEFTFLKYITDTFPMGEQTQYFSRPRDELVITGRANGFKHTGLLLVDHGIEISRALLASDEISEVVSLLLYGTIFDEYPREWATMERVSQGSHIVVSLIPTYPALPYKPVCEGACSFFSPRKMLGVYQANL